MNESLKSANGLVELVHGDSLVDIKKQNFCTKDLVVIDPPFNWEPLQIIPWIDEAVRICKTEGNILLFNNSDAMYDQVAEIKRKSRSNIEKWNLYKGLEKRESIYLKYNYAKPKLNRLPCQTMTISIFSKSINRKLYANIPRLLTNIWDPEGLGYLTDNWSEREHKPGHHGKFDIINTGDNQNFKHSTATAEWVIENLLYCFARPEDIVYDCFGGAGTVPYLCNEYGINCRSIEIDEFNYTIMLDRILQSNKNRNFASYAAQLVSKVNELQSRTTNRLGSSVSGSIENRGKELERTAPIIFVD